MTRNAVSESVSTTEKESSLTPEALLRANAVANEAIAILQDKPDGQEAIKLTFHKMISEKLRDPSDVSSIQEKLYEARDARLATMKPSERLGALEAFSRFMEGFTQNIAHMQRDIGWSNESNTLMQNTHAKMDQIRDTYAGILSKNHPTA